MEVAQDGVRVEGIRALWENNVHAWSPVLQITLDVGPFEDRSSADVPGFVDRLLAFLPELAEHGCSLGTPGGFVVRLRRGTYLAHIVEHVTLALQNRMGFDVSFGRARGTGRRGVYRVVIAYQEEEPARAAFAAALELVLAAMADRPFDIDAETERLLRVADDHRLGPSSAAIVAAARERGIPVLRLTPKRGLVQLGHGVHQRLVQASETSFTRAIAVDTCQDKVLTNELLRTVGVPVPDGRVADDAAHAWQIARRFLDDGATCVVVKPSNGNQGKGVCVGLRTEAEVHAAFEVADHYGAVLVERCIPGADHRVLVVDGRVVAVARRDPARVVGDGVHTVRELVDATNRDPRRRDGHGAAMTRIRWSEAVDLELARQSLGEDDVPAAGRVVALRSNCNLSTGGTATDVTDVVHPELARVCELAADVLGLDVAGVDVLAEDPSRPLAEQGGAIVEVNAAPGLRMHVSPSEGRPRDVGGAIVDMLFPPGAPARVPIVAITGTNGKTTVAFLSAHLFRTAQKVVGLTTTEGVYVDRERILAGDCAGPQSARAVLRHPRVEVAVLETARGGILRQGLAFDACRVAVVTNVTADHLGLGGVETLEDLVRVKQVVVEALDPDGAAVLNAEDPRVAEMASATRARTVYFASSPHHPVMRAHLAAGGAGVYVEEGAVVLDDGVSPLRLVELERVPITAGGAIAFQVQNVLAATAAAWSCGVNPAMLARGLATFGADGHAVPARMARYERDGIEVLVDYAHNPAAMRALGESLAAAPSKRTTLVFSMPGDRRDVDLRETAAATRSFAAAWVLHDLADRRGRAVDEVPELIRACLPADAPCRIAADAAEAVAVALAGAVAGERVVVIVDDVDALGALLRDAGFRPLGGAAVSVREEAPRLRVVSRVPRTPVPGATRQAR